LKEWVLYKTGKNENWIINNDKMLRSKLFWRNPKKLRELGDGINTKFQILPNDTIFNSYAFEGIDKTGMIRKLGIHENPFTQAKNLVNRVDTKNALRIESFDENSGMVNAEKKDQYMIQITGLKKRIIAATNITDSLGTNCNVEVVLADPKFKEGSNVILRAKVEICNKMKHGCILKVFSKKIKNEHKEDLKLSMEKLNTFLHNGEYITITRQYEALLHEKKGLYGPKYAKRFLRSGLKTALTKKH